MVTLYVVTTPKPRRNKEGELYMKDESIYETYSKAQLIKFLYRIYKEGGVPVGKINWKARKIYRLLHSDC